MGIHLNLHNAVFTRSVAKAKDITNDGLPQIVFSGKSNVGKSSLINRLLNRKQFARVSSTPGKTAHINYFLIDNKAYFVDLPGYGYAKVSKSEYMRWSRLMEDFFLECDCISLGIMIVDSRHRPTADDVIMANWYKGSGRPFIIVANKIDKVKNSEKEKNIGVIRETLELPEHIRVFEFSAQDGTGRNAVLSEISRSLGF